jgi:GAF domain-containing protein
MGEDYIPIESNNKAQKYLHILSEFPHRIYISNHPESNRNNLLALLKVEFGWWWVGYYFVHKDQLVLGAFQGPPACTSIDKGNGVCGKCWEIGKSIVVANVNEFEGHIACSSKSQS